MDMTPYLRAVWEMNESSNGSSAVTRNDSHGTNHLTDNNTTPSATGVLSNCIAPVRANSEYLSIANNANIQTGNASFFVWCWARLRNKTNTQHLFAKINSTVPSQEFSLYYNQPTDRFRFLIQYAGSGSALYEIIDASTFGSPATNTWYLLMGWLDVGANTLNIAVNLTADSQSANSRVTPTTSTAQLQISGQNAPGFENYADADIDQCGLGIGGLWSSADRTALYNSGNGLAYPFSAGAGGIFTGRAFGKGRIFGGSALV